jgi:hypothetical protein
MKKESCLYEVVLENGLRGWIMRCKREGMESAIILLASIRFILTQSSSRNSSVVMNET